jgi:hypothetical protein
MKQGRGGSTEKKTKYRRKKYEKKWRMKEKSRMKMK